LYELPCAVLPTEGDEALKDDIDNLSIFRKGAE